jgi:hypothetical protein
MPKNDTNKNKKDSTVQPATTATPEPVYTPAAQSAGAESEVSGTPVAARTSRRLGTAAIVGISAAGVALIAGVFGGGIALGAGLSHDPRGGMDRNASEASGQREGDRMQGDGMRGEHMQGGPMQGGPEQVGPMQGGSLPGGPGQNHDSDGPMMGDLPPLPPQTGEMSAPTPVPSPSN